MVRIIICDGFLGFKSEGGIRFYAQIFNAYLIVKEQYQ